MHRDGQMTVAHAPSLKKTLELPMPLKMTPDKRRNLLLTACRLAIDDINSIRMYRAAARSDSEW